MLCIIIVLHLLSWSPCFERYINLSHWFHQWLMIVIVPISSLQGYIMH